MAEVKALHTIHRSHPIRKGEQEVIKPGTVFLSEGRELERLQARQAVRVLDEKSGEKTQSKASKPAEKTQGKAGKSDDDGDLGDL